MRAGGRETGSGDCLLGTGGTRRRLAPGQGPTIADWPRAHPNWGRPGRLADGWFGSGRDQRNAKGCDVRG